MGLEIKQLTRLQIIRYCEKLEKENKKMKEICDIYIPRVLKLEEENRKQKLHIEAKDKAYTALLKDYEELKEKNKNLKEEIKKLQNDLETVVSAYFDR